MLMTIFKKRFLKIPSQEVEGTKCIFYSPFYILIKEKPDIQKILAFEFFEHKYLRSMSEILKFCLPRQE